MTRGAKTAFPDLTEFVQRSPRNGFRGLLPFNGVVVMSADATSQPQPQPPAPPPPPPAPNWQPLSPVERRILGVLVEKQKTSKTADAYPLTLNALQTGCNQKSNRDPVLDLDEIEVEEAAEALQPRGLVERITG